MDRESTIDIFTKLFFSLVFIAAFVVWFRLFSRRGLLILREWTAKNQLELVSYEERSFHTGPFKWWTIGKGQMVYSVVLRDRSGQERSAWVRCGSFLGGVFVKQVEVHWNDPNETPKTRGQTIKGQHSA